MWSALSLPTLARYLMGRHRGNGVSREGRAAPGEWLARVQSARLSVAPGLGLGQDLEIEGPGLAGVGLALDAFPVHVAVFPA